MPDRTRVAFITPPGWFDVTPTDLLSIAPRGWEVMQAVLPLPGFTYEMEAIKKARSVVERTAKLVAEASPDAIVQHGTPWGGFVLGRYAAVARFRERVEEATGVPYFNVSTAVVDGLRRLGARTIAVSTAYYDDAWADAYVAYLRDAGFEVAAAESFTSLGLLDGQPQSGRPPFEEFSARLLGSSVAGVGSKAPRADVVVIAGAHRTLAAAGDLELAAGRPVVAADTALFWAVLDRLGGTGPIHGHGKLLGSLGTR